MDKDLNMREEVKFRIAGKEYPIPDLTFSQYRAALKAMDEIVKKRVEGEASDVGVDAELQQLEEVRQFYLNVLKHENPDITAKMLGDMPLHQYSMEFFIKLKLALFQAPLEKKAKAKK